MPLFRRASSGFGQAFVGWKQGRLIKSHRLLEASTGMYVHIVWTKFRFDARATITEAQYLDARNQPAAFLHDARASLRASGRTAARAIFIPTVVAVVCFCAAAFVDHSHPHTWSGIVGGILVVTGCAMAFSALFTTYSFLHYAMTLDGFWRAVVATACECDQYSEFLTTLARRQRAGIGLNRKLPWWLPLLALAAVLLLVYLGLSRYPGG